MRTITVDEVYLASRRFLRERTPVPAAQAK
jgi:hypothetical protein